MLYTTKITGLAKEVSAFAMKNVEFGSSLLNKQYPIKDNGLILTFTQLKDLIKSNADLLNKIGTEEEIEQIEKNYEKTLEDLKPENLKGNDNENLKRIFIAGVKKQTLDDFIKIKITINFNGLIYQILTRDTAKLANLKDINKTLDLSGLNEITKVDIINTPLKQVKIQSNEEFVKDLVSTRSRENSFLGNLVKGVFGGETNDIKELKASKQSEGGKTEVFGLSNQDGNNLLSNFRFLIASDKELVEQIQAKDKSKKQINDIIKSIIDKLFFAILSANLFNKEAVEKNPEQISKVKQSLIKALIEEKNPEKKS